MTLSIWRHLTTGGVIPNSKGEALQMQALEAKAQTIWWRREWLLYVNPASAAAPACCLNEDRHEHF